MFIYQIPVCCCAVNKFFAGNHFGFQLAIKDYVVVCQHTMLGPVMRNSGLTRIIAFSSNSQLHN